MPAGTPITGTSSSRAASASSPPVVSATRPAPAAPAAGGGGAPPNRRPPHAANNEPAGTIALADAGRLRPPEGVAELERLREDVAEHALGVGRLDGLAVERAAHRAASAGIAAPRAGVAAPRAPLTARPPAP